MIAAVVIAGSTGRASAQGALQQVLDLNRQGMEAYMNLELEQAQSLLQRALQTAQSGGVTGAPLARTYLNLGVVAVGGFGDNGRGMNFFVQALQADSSIQLDPLTSTPEIQTVFQLARQRAGTGGGGGRGDAGDDREDGQALEDTVHGGHDSTKLRRRRPPRTARCAGARPF
ncbi:MAG TPA: hypothetical protein RMH99_30985, partial [Sandaracinaceae bacterium LLY-WYZ-13_1]|nr:hypothetical protein [Sandaracinaceae bacterium LLY-WYZ-13_1]